MDFVVFAPAAQRWLSANPDWTTLRIFQEMERFTGLPTPCGGLWWVWPSGLMIGFRFDDLLVIEDLSAR